jgi:hypothetical protein
LGKDGGDKGTRGALAFGSSYVYSFQSVKIGGLQHGSVTGPRSQGTRAAHLVSNLATPLNHLRDRLLVHALARLPYRVHDGEVGLQRVERANGGLRESDAPRRRALAAYRVVAFRHGGETVVRADGWYDSMRAQLPSYLRHEDMADMAP